MNEDACYLDDFMSFADTLPVVVPTVPVPPVNAPARHAATETVSSLEANPAPAPARTSAVCNYCRVAKPQLIRPKTGCRVCKQCFLRRFEDEVHHTITANALFRPGMRVAVGASGGKDSTVLADVLCTLNARYGYGIHILLLSIDEGITGYRDDSLETVKRNEVQYGVPLTVLSYKDLYGWTMDDIVRQMGHKSNCTYCGVFRRQALGRGAALLKADLLLTGHNCDDIAETVLLNLLRGDISRLGRSVEIVAGKNSPMPRAKPFKFTYQKEIVMYAYYKNLDYFSTECTYAPFAYRNFSRELVKDLERVAPQALLQTLLSAESFSVSTTAKRGAPVRGVCGRCGYVSSMPVCKACVTVGELNAVKAAREKERQEKQYVQPQLEQEQELEHESSAT